MSSKQKICFTSADTSACGLYRSYLPYKYLKKEFDTNVSIGFTPSNINEYLKNDIIVLQRHNHESVDKFVYLAHSLGKKVLFDLDDLLWHIPNYNFSRNHWNKQMQICMENIIKKCDLVIASTEPLALFLKRFNKNVHILPNLIEDNFIEKKSNNKIKLLYSGSITHSGDFENGVIHAIKHVLSKYDIEFYFVGYIPDEFNDIKYKDKVRFVKSIDIKEYIQTLQIINPDIAIAPLADNHFNCCKSSLKYYENTVSGAVSICSDIYPYSNAISNGYDGFICKNKGKVWIDTFERLIENPPLIKDIYSNARSTVIDKYTWTDKNIDIMCNKYKELISSLY